MEEIREQIKKLQRQKETSEDNGAPASEINKIVDRIRAWEEKHKEVCDKYQDSDQAESEQKSVKEDIQVFEDLKGLEEEEEEDTIKSIKEVRKLKECMDTRVKKKLEKTLDRNLTSEQREIAKKDLERAQEVCQKTEEDERIFEETLIRQNEEDKEILADRNATRDKKNAARERIAERNEVLGQNERDRPLSERVKDIFKKYGVGLTAILLAAGITIGAVIGVITRALKATGKAMGKGLKEIGKKTASLLPRLLGSIVGFLFKAAGQVIGFLAEYTWLLIVAAVAFLLEMLIKRRRR